MRRLIAALAAVLILTACTTQTGTAAPGTTQPPATGQAAPDGKSCAAIAGTYSGFYENYLAPLAKGTVSLHDVGVALEVNLDMQRDHLAEVDAALRPAWDQALTKGEAAVDAIGQDPQAGYTAVGDYVTAATAAVKACTDAIK